MTESVFPFHVFESEVNRRRNEAPYMGEFLGHEDLHKIIRLYLGHPFVIYGFGGTGKTFLWFDFAINLSEHKSIQHFIWCPEMGNAEDIYELLIRMYIRKPINKIMPGGIANDRCCSDDEFEKGKDFISKHFYVHQPKPFEEATIENVYLWKKSVEGKTSMKFSTILIDPFSYLRKSEGFNNIWDHVQHTLEKAREHDAMCKTTTVIITHAGKPDRKIIEGKSISAMPNKQMMHGGMAWEKSADNILLVFNPDHNVMEVDENELWLRTDKIRPFLAGKPNETVSIYKDYLTLRYYEKRDEF